MKTIQSGLKLLKYGLAVVCDSLHLVLLFLELFIVESSDAVENDGQMVDSETLLAFLVTFVAGSCSISYSFKIALYCFGAWAKLFLKSLAIFRSAAKSPTL